MNESWHTDECYHIHELQCLWHTYARAFVTRMKKSCHTYEWVMAHVWMSHGTHMNASWHRSHTCIFGSLSFVWGTWLVCTCDMTHTWLIHMWDMTHSYVGHESFTCVTWLIHKCEQVLQLQTHSWRIQSWDMTHSYVGYDSFIRWTWLIHTCEQVLELQTRSWRIHSWDMAYS